MSIEAPTPEAVKAARTAAGLSQQQACALVHLKRRDAWSDFECGRVQMSAALWELFRIKTGTHPAYRPAEATEGA